MWVKAHTGLKGNEYVDSLAKDSILNGLPTNLHLNLNDSYNMYKSIVFDKWNAR